MSEQELKKILEKQRFGARPYTPWIREHLSRSIWKNGGGETGALKNCRTKELEGRKKTISIHMGKPLLSESIEVLNLSVRAHNCLKRCGIFTIADLMERVSSEEDLLKIRNLGRKSAEEILTKLEGYEQALMREEEQGGHPSSLRKEGLR